MLTISAITQAPTPSIRDNDASSRAKFQTFLRKLFQLEGAEDLDFGIYRIFNYRRDVYLDTCTQ